MARGLFVALMLASTLSAQFPPPPPPAPPANPPKYEEPPEEDESIATERVYTFNPLQAKKEISTGDFYMAKGNARGAAMRYREATLWDDGSADAFFKWGEASEKLKDYATAREAFTKFLALSEDKKKVADAQKRLAKYPKDAAGPKSPGGTVSIDEARKEDRAINGTARGRGIITIMK